MSKTCNARMWSYDHWYCTRDRHLFGRHRYNNYTGARIPQVWRIRDLVRVRNANKRLRKYDKTGTKGRMLDYHRVLFPDRYEPIPVAVPDSLVRAAEAVRNARSDR
jgi:hypothetical protein